MVDFVGLKRVFRYKGLDLQEPNEGLFPEEVLSHYAQQYPRLAGGKIVELGVEGDALVFEMREGGFGDKG